MYLLTPTAAKTWSGSPGIPDNSNTLYIYSDGDLERLYALLNGDAVTLGDGTTVPATQPRAGRSYRLPRGCANLLKFRTLMEYGEVHRRRLRTGYRSSPFSVEFDDESGERGWWTHGSNWRHMYKSMHGLDPPDWEH